MKSTNILVPTTLIIAAFALIGMPQMISPVNAQSERASERACPTGFTLERGECTAVPIETVVCEPTKVGDFTVRLLSNPDICRAETGTFIPPSVTSAFIQACNQIPGSDLDRLTGSFGATFHRCTFPVTEEITCPGDVLPTGEGECITKPGRGRD